MKPASLNDIHPPMTLPTYEPVLELLRAQIIESLHNGAVAIVDVYGQMLAYYGDPDTVTFLRSSAKPFQVLPFLEAGGKKHYDLTNEEVAVLCASHSGTDLHVATVSGIQHKVGINEDDLLCGTHTPADEKTAEALQTRGEKPTPNRHNCSGKHTGMLAYASMTNQRYPDIPYISPQHPIQQTIIQTFADLCGLKPDQVAQGIDGCSAPNFAVPLRNVAWAFARLCDPVAGNVMPPARQAACRQITAAMMEYPFMVAGPHRFDTLLMQTAAGKLVCKGGAEGYQGIGLMPGVLGPGSPAIGIALKIGDGDARGKARAAVSLEILRQLGALSPDELQALAEFGPTFPVYNWREILVGQGRPVFELHYGT